MTLPFAQEPVPDLQQLGDAAASVRTAILSAERDPQQLYRPTASWTRRQLAWHIADTETAICLRLCHILAEERPLLGSIPEDRWASLLPQGRSLAVAADWFLASRRTVLDLLPGVEPVRRSRIGIHATLGPMTFDETLRHLHHHALHHARQLDAYGG